MSETNDSHEIIIRNRLQPGDMGSIIYLHGILYADQCGFNYTFEPYVAAPLAEFVKFFNSRERIWIVEKDGSVMGSAALVRASDQEAQLRWLLLHPKIRGLGVGRKLVEEVILFAQECGYHSIFLLTVDILPQAACLYRSVGFKITEETRIELWGIEMTEQKYEIKL